VGDDLKKNRLFTIAGIVVAVAAIGCTGYVLGKGTLPVGVVSHFGPAFLLAEAQTMYECAECHEAEAFHDCTTCHDDHGAVELLEVPFFNMVAFTGDVPNPGFIRLNDILPYREQPHTQLVVEEFLAEQGVKDFESVTFASNDGGYVTIAPADLNERALLLPYADGIRFASEDLHVSTWLKGITRIIVVGAEKPLTINGEATSIGRLLMGPTQAVTVQQTDVMFVSEEDGQTRTAKTAYRLEGAPVDIVVGPFETLLVTNASGETVEVPAADANNAILVAERGGVTLVLPDFGRGRWVEKVVEIEAR